MRTHTTTMLLAVTMLDAGGGCDRVLPGATLPPAADAGDAPQPAPTVPDRRSAGEDASTSGPTCTAPQIPEEEVRKMIEKERATRADLPRAFATSAWTVRRIGCHYTAIESMVPATPEANHVFRLNQKGVIVDVTVGNSRTSDLRCPKKTLGEAELVRTVADARAARGDLPPPFAHAKTRVDRARCTYMYFEYRVPETRGDYQVFIIDPFGELMEFQRSQPY